MTTNRATEIRERELTAEDLLMWQECSQNIIKNIDRALSEDRDDHRQVSRLLSARWYVSNEIDPKTS